MPLISSLMLLIALTQILGKLAQAARLPAVTGEILAGVILGPMLLNLVSPNVSISAISDLAVFMIVLAAGLEMDFRGVIAVLKKRGLPVALLSFAIPLAAGLGTGIFFGIESKQALVLGLCMAVTALPVAVRTLESFKLLNTPIAYYTITIAIVNDIVVFLALGLLLNFQNAAQFGAVAQTAAASLGKITALLALVWCADRAFSALVKRSFLPLKKELGAREAQFSFAVLFTLAFSALGELLGLHFVIGGFFGALLLRSELFGAAPFKELTATIRSVTNGLLAPVFFAFIGLAVNVKAPRSLGFVSAVILLSIGSKIIAGRIGGKVAGVSEHEAWGIGIITNSRGVMGLVVASTALQRGLIDAGVFSTVVLMDVFTTLAAPILFRGLLKIKKPAPLREPALL